MLYIKENLKVFEKHQVSNKTIRYTMFMWGSAGIVVHLRHKQQLQCNADSSLAQLI